MKFYNRDGECINTDRKNLKMRAGRSRRFRILRCVNNLFRGYTSDPLHQMADTRAGAMSIGIGNCGQQVDGGRSRGLPE